MTSELLLSIQINLPLVLEPNVLNSKWEGKGVSAVIELTAESELVGRERCLSIDVFSWACPSLMRFVAGMRATRFVHTPEGFQTAR